MINVLITGVTGQDGAYICRVPDDCIDPRRRALFLGRETMRELIEELRRQKS